VSAWFIVTVQVPVPGQLTPLPLQPVNVLLPLAVAVSTTDVPELYVCEHVAPQLMNVSPEVIVPLPLPLDATVRSYVFCVNVAVTLVAALIVTVHGLVPEDAHTPLQPVKVKPLPADGNSATDEPLSKLWLQVPDEHEMPDGNDVTVPVPAIVTFSANWLSVNAAVTDLSEPIATVHGFPAPQPEPENVVNVLFAAGVAVITAFAP
jgi:hypothetical protein